MASPRNVIHSPIYKNSSRSNTIHFSFEGFDLSLHLFFPSGEFAVLFPVTPWFLCYLSFLPFTLTRLTTFLLMVTQSFLRLRHLFKITLYMHYILFELTVFFPLIIYLLKFLNASRSRLNS